MKRFSNILLVVDTEAENAVALSRAVALARNNQASLTIVSVVEEMSSNPTRAILWVELCIKILGEERARLDNVIASVAEPDINITSKTLVGKPFIEFIRQVLRHDHDLVIKCADEPQDVARTLFGSTDMHLLRKCPCPIWIIKSTGQAPFSRILAALDHDPENPATTALNRQILEMSTSLALSESCELDIVHAWRLAWESFMRSPRSTLSKAEVDEMVAEEGQNRRHWLDSLVTTYGAKADKDAMNYLNPRLHLLNGRATQVVPTTARELGADLVIMGTVGRSGVAGLLMGNTAENILAQLDCSVLAIKPPGFETPVSS